MEKRRREREKAAARDSRRGRGVIQRARPHASAERRDRSAAFQLSLASTRRAQSARPHFAGRENELRPGITRALRRGRAHFARVALRENSRATGEEAARQRTALAALRNVAQAVRRAEGETGPRLPARDRGMPPAHSRSPPSPA